MANLKPCVGCGTEVDEKIKKCPNCGKPYPTMSSKEGCLGLIILSVIVGVALSFCGNDDNSHWSKTTQAEWLSSSQPKQQEFAEHFAWIFAGKPDLSDPYKYKIITDWASGLQTCMLGFSSDKIMLAKESAEACNAGLEVYYKSFENSQN